MKNRLRNLILSCALVGVPPLTAAADGGFTDAALISSFNGETASPPAVGMANSGEAIIAYRRPSDATVRGFYRAGYGAPFTTKTLGQNAATPKVIVNDAGDMLAGWIAFSGVTVSYKKRGTSTFVEKLLEVNSGVGGEIGLAMNSLGDIQVAWKSFQNDAPGPRYEIHTYFKEANTAFSPAGTYDYTVALNTDGNAALVALDDNRNAALYWIDDYANLNNPDPYADETLFGLKQMLRQGQNGSWSAPVFVSPTKGSGDIACDSSFSNYPNVSSIKLASDPKTGLLGVAYHGSNNWSPYQAPGAGGDPDHYGRCTNSKENYHFGFATMFGTILNGVSNATFAYSGEDLLRSSFAVANSSSAVAFETGPVTGSPTVDQTFHLALGNPGPSESQSFVPERLVDVRASMGADGTALATSYGGAGPAFGDPLNMVAAHGYVSKQGAPNVRRVLMNEAKVAGVGANCRGDGIFAILTDGNVNGVNERNLYFVEYDSGAPTCIAGFIDPTPVPTPTPTPTPTLDPGAPTAVPTIEPTVDILAQAKKNSSKMYIALTNFYNAIKAMKHPLIKKNGGTQKLKNVKLTWKALQVEFPHSVVPELIYIAGKNEANFKKYYQAMKKNYRTVINDKDDEREYRDAKRTLTGAPDVMRRMLGYF